MKLVFGRFDLEEKQKKTILNSITDVQVFDTVTCTR